MKALALTVILYAIGTPVFAGTFVEAKTDIEVPAKAASITLMRETKPDSNCVMFVSPAYSPRKIPAGSKFEVSLPVQFTHVAYTLAELIAATEKLFGIQLGRSFTSFDEFQKFAAEKFGILINDPNIGVTLAQFQLKSLSTSWSYQVSCRFELNSTLDDADLVKRLDSSGALKPSVTDL